MGIRKKKKGRSSENNILDERVLSYADSDDKFVPDYSKPTKIAIIIWVVLAGLFTYINKPWIFVNMKDLMKKLSDIFFIPGIALLAIAVIAFATGDGLFDGIGYSVSSMREIKHSDRPQESYLDYKKRMASKEFLTRPFFIVAGISLLLAILFTGIYLNSK